MTICLRLFIIRDLDHSGAHGLILMSARTRQLLHLPGQRVAIVMLALGSLIAVLAPAPAIASSPRSTSPALAQVALQALGAVQELDDFNGTHSVARSLLASSRYVRLRDEAAGLAAVDLGVPAAMLRDAWALTDIDKQTALLAALTQLGVPYRSHRSEPGVGFDCSGLTAYAWGVAGQELARQSRTQINGSLRVERTAARAGDLMFYPGHVMIFLGIGDAMVHSPQSGSEVEITFLSERHSRDVVFADPTL
jgi:cell wall-associated NlpC family hydrolase